MLLDFPPHRLAMESIDLLDCRDCLDACFSYDMRIVYSKLLNLLFRVRSILKLPLFISFKSGSSLLILESCRSVPTLTNAGVHLSFEYLGVSRFLVEDRLVSSSQFSVLLRLLCFSIDVTLFLRVNLRWD